MAFTSLGIGVAFALSVWRVDWEEDIPVGEYAVALGTIALAFATFRLGQHTRRQSDLTQEALEAADRPYVIATPHGHHPEGISFEMADQRCRLCLRLWNIGRGPAIVWVVSLKGRGATRELIIEQTGPRALAVDGVADFAPEANLPLVIAGTHFTLTIVYADASGRRFETTQHLVREKPGDHVLASLSFEMRRVEPGE